ncbi:hypothetical protein AN478_06010 [Thiohalorhabdus denitrificans]|uniref:PrcB C-terminal n=1 Tax=Thiohalorhabdus denitrificans TaxID=381306 RepID=A0A0N8PN71_9GAMM|nr:protease complex subunit PrcB family protein [Thiohalorhabdus denitrificans]KPV40709.1 hypothetical protein AN478_06010 [Thiohalorhabdus denitrificans]SCY46377.1 PrcB C-terminal [Thiohalorhabdus denitrificans]
MTGWGKALGRGSALAVWLVLGADAAHGGGVPLPDPAWGMRGAQCGPEEPTAVRVSGGGGKAAGFELGDLEGAGSGTRIVVGAGTRPTGGYRLELGEPPASQRGRTLVVRVAVRPPPEGAMVTQALTRPCGVLRIPGTGGFDRVEVRLNERAWRFPLGDGA